MTGKKSDLMLWQVLRFLNWQIPLLVDMNEDKLITQVKGQIQYALNK